MADEPETGAPSENPGNIMTRKIRLPQLPISSWPFAVAAVLMCYHTLVLLNIYGTVHCRLIYTTDNTAVKFILRAVEEDAESGTLPPAIEKARGLFGKQAIEGHVRMNKEARKLLSYLEMYHITGLVALALGIFCQFCRDRGGRIAGIVAGTFGFLMAGIIM